MMPVRVPDNDVYAGDTGTFGPYVIKEDGVAVNLTGWTWECMWRPHDPEGNPAVTLTVDSSLATSGTISITATTTQTRAMGGNGVWDLQGTKAGVVKTWLMGATTWYEDVTRA